LRCRSSFSYCKLFVIKSGVNMRRCKKDVEVTLDDGTVIEAVLTVTEFVDEEFNSDTPPLVGSWQTAHDEELDDEQQSEFDERVEEIVFEEKWNFEDAAEDDEDTEEED
jgi:hypothetical protein